MDKRDPYKLYHKMTPAELGQLTPSFDWSGYLEVAGLGGARTLNVTEPAFFRAVEAQLQGESLEHWKAYFRWHVVDGAAPYLSKSFVDEDFAFNLKYLRGLPKRGRAGSVAWAMWIICWARPGPGVRAPDFYGKDPSRTLCT